jgi:Fe-S cluster assembly ATP-binding protein
MLKISHLCASINQKPILNNLSLTLYPGEMHVLMGPNGSGKSTLASVIAGHPSYEVTSGSVYLDETSLLDLPVHERSLNGVFVAFQYPLAIPGMTLMSFLKEMLNAHRKYKGLPLVDAADFLVMVKEKAKVVGLPESFLYRSLNEGFSGGEKKRCEILQMLLLEPMFIVLDETDSGLDVDALKQIALAIEAFRNPKSIFLVITHYQRLLNFLTPDKIHIFAKGQVICSGGQEIAMELEQKGYESFLGHRSNPA